VNRRYLAGGAAAVVVAAVFLVLSSLFTVRQGQQALVLQFGNAVRVVSEPGLHAKVPFIQGVEYLEKRVLDFDAPSVELVLGDQKRLVVDAFARYRIANPLLFRQSVGSELAFRGRLEPIVFSSLRSIFGGVSLFQVLSRDRAQLLTRLREEANGALSRFGVELVDVRIKRADLPAENSQAIFRRMQTERDREAKQLRAEGAEIGQRIRAGADRERRVIIAEAQRASEVLRGQGDADAIRIFAEAFGQDVGFFDFYRSMQAYRTALSDGATSLVLSPQSEFFRYLNQVPRPVAGPGAPGGAAATGPGLAQDVPPAAATAVAPPPAVGSAAVPPQAIPGAAPTTPR
jgi:membrane protease subunit HflC